MFLLREEFGRLIDALRDAGYDCVGPQVRDGAVVYERLDDVEQLPRGFTDEQAPGRYRLAHGGHERFFAWANGPHALKPLAFAPREVVWQAQRQEGGIAFEPVAPAVRPTAVLGVRACDLAALALQDAHFLRDDVTDGHYRARRESLFLVAVNCSHSAATCFCASTGDGPAVRAGYDLKLDELDEGFVVAAGSVRGADLLTQLPLQPAMPEQIGRAAEQTHAVAASQTRTIPAGNLYPALLEKLNSARWDEVASRCLSCGNCTSVCPTCFCHSLHDEASLDGERVEHVRQWDSCFTSGHSELHGIPVRGSTAFRYRQWLTHKLGSWHEQYGRSGCVGCGRCISWCPAGIDLSAEVTALLGEAS